jgi:hypothetical protein
MGRHVARQVAAHDVAKDRCALLFSDQGTQGLFSRFTDETSEFKLVKLKVKFTLEQAAKAQGGSRCTALLFP